MFREFSWEEFDQSVEIIIEKSKNWNLSGVYGIPRGGLCLAVAISHKLNLQLYDQPGENILIVDDIYDSGKTLECYKDYIGAKYFVIFSKLKPTWWNSVRILTRDEWVVFPWEDKDNYKYDKYQYKEKNKL